MFEKNLPTNEKFENFRHILGAFLANFRLFWAPEYKNAP